MAVKKMTITKDGVTRGIDLTTTTAIDEVVVKGYTYKRADGTDGTGTLEQSSGGGSETLTADSLSEVMALCTEENLGKYVKAVKIQGANDGYNRGRVLTFRICKPIISFTLSCGGYTSTRTCEEGMTWKDFEYSVYSQSRASYIYVTSDNKVVHYWDSTYAYIPKDFQIDGVTGDDVIMANTTYTGTTI